jgi:hypothetical protein
VWLTFHSKDEEFNPSRKGPRRGEELEVERVLVDLELLGRGTKQNTKTKGPSCLYPTFDSEYGDLHPTGGRPRRGQQLEVQRVLVDV